MDTQNQMISTGSRLDPNNPNPTQQGVSNPTPVTGGADDFVDNPNYNPSASQPQDEFVDNPNFKDPNASDELQVNPDDSVLTKGAKYLGGTAEGIGEGLFKTLAGSADLLGAKGTGVSKELHKLAGDENAKHGTAQNVGQGLETIGEFLLGDEALKGLSMADRLTQVSKVMKVVEKSPRLAQALRLGINVGKAGAELGPEERAALQKYPILARLAGAGMDALRQGLVQFEQTGLKGGTDKEALESGANMAGTSAVLGGVLGAAGGLLQKGREAADNAAALRASAEQAPTGVEANQAFQQTAENAIQPTIEHAQGVQDAAQQTLDQAGQDVGQLAVNAPEHEAITASTQKATKNAYEALGNEFEKGRNQLIDLGEGHAVDYEGSPLHQAAQELTESGKKAMDPLDEAFAKSRPGSEKANAMLEKLIDPYGEKELQETIDAGTKTDAEGNKVLSQKAQDAQKELDAIAEKKQNNPIQLSVEGLLDRRKLLNERLRNTGWMTDEQRADRQVYRRLIQGIDDSLQSIMDQTGKPEATDILKNMNQAYKTGISRFDNPDVEALLQGKTNDVAKRLMGGQTSVDDINTVRAAIGDDAFNKLSDSSLSRMVADSVDKNTGEFSFKNFFRKWDNISPQVRDAMFKDAIGRDTIDRAIEATQRVNASEVIPETQQAIDDATKTMKNILGNGDVSSLIKDPSRVQSLAQMVGPEGMGELGHTILQNQLREAATNKAGKVGQVDTGKFLNFIASLKDSPEVVDALFKPTPETSAAYDKLLNSVHNVDRVKEMVKLGVLVPSIGAAGGAAGGILGHSLFSVILGATAAEGTGFFKAAREALDHVANSKAMWSALKTAQTASESPTAEGANTVSRAVAGKIANHVRQQLQPKPQANPYGDLQGQLSQ